MSCEWNDDARHSGDEMPTSFDTQSKICGIKWDERQQTAASIAPGVGDVLHAPMAWQGCPVAWSIGSPFAAHF
jgi:hypothetical protein